MAGGYDGSIRINTSINTSPINRGISQIEGMLGDVDDGFSQAQSRLSSIGDGFSRMENKLKSIAASIGLAFGAKELVDFGKNAINAASDLTEAQNVVDTAFGDMSWKMEQFAATALDTYGISELTAKTMGSTYMAMARGMGVATDAASDMAVTLTGRLSDIMSFYNKTQSEVDTIGRAMITGETEPLKAIGVVMTQTNLSAYAMAQGFAKTYDEMSSNEQLLVRYKYFLEQTALAQGDFAKTSEGWANQTRLLSERWNEFVTNFGELIMNTFTPALQFANEAVSFLNELFFGGNDNSENATAVKNAEAVTDEVTSMGAAADKSKKKLNNLIAGFDELHIISGTSSDEEQGQTTDAGIDTSNLLGVNLDADTNTAKKAAGKYKDIINEIYLAFKRHPLTKAIEGIITSIGEFFGFIKDSGDMDAESITRGLMNILGAIIAFKTVKGVIGGVLSFIKGFDDLVSLIAKHPVVAAVLGITALVVGITALTIGIIKWNEEMERQRIASHFGDISISLEEINDLVNPITENVEKVAGAFEDNKSRLKIAKDNFSAIAKAVQETADSFKNNNLEQDVEGFAKQLDNFLDSALELNSATYDTSDLRALFMSDGELDEEEQAILNEIDSLGGEVADKITSYGEEIHKITQAAIDENRELTDEEIANLKKLYQKLADMTAQQESIKSAATWERLKNGDYTYDSYAELADKIKEAQEQEKKARDEVEQSGYEKMMNIAASMKANGKSDAEINKFKEGMTKEIKESVDKMEQESLRNQRDVILAYGQGAFTNMAKSYTSDPEELKKMQEYYELMLSMPDDVNPLSAFSMVELDGRSVNMINHVKYLVKDGIKDELGLDLTGELAELNKQLGDTGYSIDDYYSALKSTLSDFTGLDVSDILPTAEEFKEMPDTYTNILNEWIRTQQAAVTLGLDTSAAEEEMDKYIEKMKQKTVTVPFVSPQYDPTTQSNNQQPQPITITLVLDGERKETITTTSGAVASMMLGTLGINNGKGM